MSKLVKDTKTRGLIRANNIAAGDYEGSDEDGKGGRKGEEEKNETGKKYRRERRENGSEGKGKCETGRRETSVEEKEVIRDAKRKEKCASEEGGSEEEKKGRMEVKGKEKCGIDKGGQRVEETEGRMEGKRERRDVRV